MTSGIAPSPAGLRGANTVNDSRNIKVVAALIASMTVGGAVLLLLESPRPRWTSGALLTAEQALQIEDVSIALLEAGREDAWDAFDCVILPSGECRWQPRGPNIQLAVVASEGDTLPDVQARRLLEAIASMNQVNGLALSRVRVDPNSDPRVHSDLPPLAHDLLALLLRKSVVP